jgi:hypothetical protein
MPLGLASPIIISASPSIITSRSPLWSPLASLVIIIPISSVSVPISSVPVPISMATTAVGFISTATTAVGFISTATTAVGFTILSPAPAIILSTLILLLVAPGIFPGFFPAGLFLIRLFRVLPTAIIPLRSLLRLLLFRVP